jgi:hypothetical protein
MYLFPTKQLTNVVAGANYSVTIICTMKSDL